MIRFTLTATLLSLPGLAAADTAQHGLDGTYESIACEVRPQVQQDGSIGPWWLTRRLTIKHGRIEAEFTTYGAPGCQAPLNILAFAGSVDVLGPSAVMDGAVEADLTIDEFVPITPLADGFAAFLNGAGNCGAGDWAVGTAQDILPTGCAPLGVAPNTPTIEYEVLAATADHIYFGARPVDGTFLTAPEDRPTALLVPARRTAP